MGCGNSIARPVEAANHEKGDTAPSSSSVVGLFSGGSRKPKRSTFTSIATFDSLDSVEHGYFGMRVTKRYGHPSYFRLDGYDVGLRVRV